ncbi:extracellular solute-binding protein, partial [Streptomyces iakyrus]|uniref:extracellular solute-binding protein n=1 Tax=Streptomyces iakyrus TaxID=68219 RepID=UPI001FD7AC97
MKAFQGGRSMCNPDGDLPELEFALLADGVPMDKLYPLDVDRAFKVLTRLRGDIKKFWDSGPLPGVLLSRQEVTMSTVWDGRIADLQKQGVPVTRQLNGMRRQFQGYAIAKGAANADNAYQLMDFSLRAESQAALAKAFPSNPSSPVAYKQLTEEERNALAGAPKYYDKGFDADVDWWLKNESAVTKRLGFVFQQYLLFPHMTVQENVAFPLTLRGVGKDEIRRRVGETLEIAGLSRFGGRKPRELSGGQQQRVALCRALVYRPPVILMDEPLGALDKKLRDQLQVEIKTIQQELGLTVIYVTHDQEEALVMSDRIAVMRNGLIEQFDTPRELF